MRKLSQSEETTVYMTVEDPPGISVEYVRTPFGEWCKPLALNASPTGDNLQLVPRELAYKLEALYNHE